MSEKRWLHKPLPAPEEVRRLGAALNISQIPATLLLQRKVESFEAAKTFFRPELEDLHDPFLMRDMEKAVRRVQEAIRKQERILIYGDYDVDGVTSVALVYESLRELHANLSHFIPRRDSEGYGFSRQGAAEALRQNPDLIITLDCGINDVNGVSYAREQGVDTIICDHHLPDGEIPPAVAILNPKQRNCSYPFKGLSGCGVGFKFMQGLYQAMERSELSLFARLDLLAVSICADIVPMVGENRILVHYGLQKLEKSPIPGLSALRGIVSRDQKLSVSNVVFRIAPRINVAGRLGSAKEALDLLLCHDRKIALALAKRLEDKNVLRRQLEQQAFRDACRQVEQQFSEDSGIVVYSPEWHIGILGIVAARCAERFHRPAVVLGKTGNFAVGSGRSAGGFDLHTALGDCAETLLTYGGHKQAAGVKLLPEQIPAFRRLLNAAIEQRATERLHTPWLEVDMEIELSQLNKKNYGIITQMAPFGPGNMRPVFSARGVRVTGSVRKIKQMHVACQLRHGEQTWSAIAFQKADKFPVFNSGHLLDIVFVVRQVNLYGREYLELEIRDVRLHQPHEK